MRTACTIVHAAQSIDYADPSVAQHKHRVGGEIASLAAWINVVKRKELDFMTGIHRADLCAVARFLPFVWSEEWWMSMATIEATERCAAHVLPSAQSTFQIGLRNFYKSTIIDWKLMRTTCSSFRQIMCDRWPPSLDWRVVSSGCDLRQPVRTVMLLFNCVHCLMLSYVLFSWPPVFSPSCKGI